MGGRYRGRDGHVAEPLMEEGSVGIRGVKTGPTTFRAVSIEEWD